eukprot:1288060-Prorocentrum_lima.AAC.1
MCRAKNARAPSTPCTFVGRRCFAIRHSAAFNTSGNGNCARALPRAILTALFSGIVAFTALAPFV